MVVLFGIAQEEAVAGINRHWPHPAGHGPQPLVWIVGRDVAYHETPGYRACSIYYGSDSR